MALADIKVENTEMRKERLELGFCFTTFIFLWTVETNYTTAHIFNSRNECNTQQNDDSITATDGPLRKLDRVQTVEMTVDQDRDAVLRQHPEGGGRGHRPLERGHVVVDHAGRGHLKVKVESKIKRSNI